MVELHGTNNMVECQSCHRRSDPEPYFESFRQTRRPPRCQCGGLLTPATVHHGKAEAVRSARQIVLTAAHAAHPERFVRRPPQPLALPGEVWINPPADRPEPRLLQLPRDTNFETQLSQTG